MSRKATATITIGSISRTQTGAFPLRFLFCQLPLHLRASAGRVCIVCPATPLHARASAGRVCIVWPCPCMSGAGNAASD